MTALPTGTVTLVFTDIEGSTALLSRLGSAYADALDGMRAILRRAWSEGGGIELGTEGDSFYVVFESAPAALAAAVQAQRELGSWTWPTDGVVRVRMGMHSGTPTAHDDAYVGMDVHRAARVAGAAHGGQIVLSAASAELVGDRLPAGVRLRDLGSHHLKDIARPERVFEAVGDGLEVVGRPLKSLGTASRLPATPTPTVGRDGELAELAESLASPEVRLLTLTGPGGSGKTRLATEVARRLVDRFPDGVYFVALAGVGSSEQIWPAVAEALDLPPEGRIPPAFFSHVEHRSALLVLDNLEHLPGADRVVEDLLNEARQVVVVATSRRPLHVAYEFEHAVPPLELPAGSTDRDVASSGAVQLFEHQARRVRSGFRLDDANRDAVAEICRRLDGLPLALELAAARLKLLSAQALLARLDTALDMEAATSGGPDRQKTLRQTIAWSYNLLSAGEQRVIRRLGVFSGGADLADIAAVVNLDGDLAEVDPIDVVAALVDASLLVVEEAADGEPRVRLLETVRAFALDQLAAAGELDAVRERHAAHFAALVTHWRREYGAGDFYATGAWFDREIDNVREALRWSVGDDGRDASTKAQVEIGLELVRGTSFYWGTKGYSTEGRGWLKAALARASESPRAAECHALLAGFCRDGGDLAESRAMATQGVEVARRIGDPLSLALTLDMLASIDAEVGDVDAARAHFDESLALNREVGDPQRLDHVLGEYGLFESRVHNYERSLELESEALEIARASGHRPGAVMHAHNLACTLRLLGRVDESAASMRASIPEVVDLASPSTMIVVTEDLACVLAELGQFEQAARLLGAADAMNERQDTKRSPQQAAEIAAPIARARAELTPEQWSEAYAAGRATPIDQALTEAQGTG